MRKKTYRRQIINKIIFIEILYILLIPTTVLAIHQDSTLLILPRNDEGNDCFYDNPGIETIYSFSFEAQDRNNDGLNDKVSVTMDVDTTLEASIWVTARAYLKISGQPETIATVEKSWIIHYQDSDPYTFDVLVPDNAPSGTYTLLVNIYDEQNNYETTTGTRTVGTLYPLNPPKKWTIMVYMAADNDLYFDALTMINWMEVCGSTFDVNYIVLFDGMIPGDSKLYRISKDLNGLDTNVISPVLDDNGAVISSISHEVNMGDPLILSSFVTWATEKYPANHYMLIPWSHGSGFSGLCMDFSSGADSFTMDEFKNAMNEIKSVLTFRSIGSTVLDILYFDPCNMASIEVYYQIRNTVNIIIGSQEMTQPPAWDYIMNNLNNNPELSANDLSQDIVQLYIQYYQEIAPMLNILTLSAYKLDVVCNQLITKISSLKNVLQTKRTAYDLPIFIQKITNSINSAEKFETASGQRNYDLYDFVDKLSMNFNDNDIQVLTSEIKNLMKNNALIEEQHQLQHPNAHGLSIYIEPDISRYDSVYDTLDFSIQTGWNAFLKNLLSDNYEPDDDPSFAQNIYKDGTEQFHIFSSNADKDWVKFLGFEGATYTIETSGLSADCDTKISLFDSDATTLIDSNDDYGLGLESRIEWTCPITGEYYLMVEQSTLAKNRDGSDDPWLFYYDLSLTSVNDPGIEPDFIVRPGERIQNAIDAASDSDLIYVLSGHYDSWLTIDKTIRLQGQNKETTIIDGLGIFTVIHLYSGADYCTIQDLTIQHGATNGLPEEAGIFCPCDHVNVKNCIFTDVSFGLWNGGSFNRFTDNTFTGLNMKAAIILGGAYNSIIGNTIEGMSTGGVEVLDDNNDVYHNNFINNPTHAWDDGVNNHWDGGAVEGGNYWSGWSSGWYYVPGPGNGIDHYPFSIPNGWNPS